MVWTMLPQGSRGVWCQGSVSGDIIHLWTVAPLGCLLWTVSKEAFPTPGMVCGGPGLWECVLMDSTINNASLRSMVFFSHLRCLLEGACPGRARKAEEGDSSL